LQSVCCQICGEEIALVHPDETKARIKSGEYVTRRHVKSSTWGDGTHHDWQEGVFGICRKCRREDATRPVKGGSDAQADAQIQRIRERVEWVRFQRGDLTLEEAVHAAIEDEFDISNEPNGGLRAYLLEQAKNDPAVDEAARQLLAKFDELESVPRD
jgi:hypothetical protein